MTMTNKALDELRAQIVALQKENDEALSLAYFPGTKYAVSPMRLRDALQAMLNVISDYIAMRRDNFKALELFDALAIWTGADDLVHDRLIYLLSGMAGYCDPAKTETIVKAVAAKWKE